MSVLLLLASLISASGARFSQPAAKDEPNLFAWTDTCNVYVLRDGDAAILIDLCDGSVLDHLGGIGVKRAPGCEPYFSWPSDEPTIAAT